MKQLGIIPFIQRRCGIALVVILFVGACRLWANEEATTKTIEKNVEKALGENYNAEGAILKGQQSLSSILEYNQQHALEIKKAYEEEWKKKKGDETPIISKVWDVGQTEDYSKKLGRAWALQLGLDACAGKWAGIGLAVGIPLTAALIATAILCPPCVSYATQAALGSYAGVEGLIGIISGSAAATTEAAASVLAASVGGAEAAAAAQAAIMAGTLSPVAANAVLAGITSGSIASASGAGSAALAAGAAGIGTQAAFASVMAGVTTLASSLPQQLMPPPGKLGPVEKCYYQVMALLKLALFHKEGEPYAPFAYLFFENHTDYLIEVTFDRAIAPDAPEASYNILLSPGQENILYGIGAYHLRTIKFNPIKKSKTTTAPDGSTSTRLIIANMPRPVYAKRPLAGLAPAVNEVIATKIRVAPDGKIELYDLKGLEVSTDNDMKKKDDEAYAKNPPKKVNESLELTPAPVIQPKEMAALGKVVGAYFRLLQGWKLFQDAEHKLAMYQEQPLMVAERNRLEPLRKLMRPKDEEINMQTILQAVQDILSRFNSQEQEREIPCLDIATLRNAVPARTKVLLETTVPKVKKDMAAAMTSIDKLAAEKVLNSLETQTYLVNMKKYTGAFKDLLTQLETALKPLATFPLSVCPEPVKTK